MKMVPLADVLWDAANRFLAAGALDVDPDRHVSPYSCDAVLFVLRYAPNYQNYTAFREAQSFLFSLGCPSGDEAFKRTPAKKRQGVRYMWLLLAMHVAEDERIMIEVEE
jgi:hypothetical protein